MDEREKKLEKLYNPLHRCNNVLIRGGIYDEELYERAMPKMLFLLKEANEPEAGTEWSFPDLVDNERQSCERGEALRPFANAIGRSPFLIQM